LSEFVTVRNAERPTIPTACRARTTRMTGCAHIGYERAQDRLRPVSHRVTAGYWPPRTVGGKWDVPA